MVANVWKKICRKPRMYEKMSKYYMNPPAASPVGEIITVTVIRGQNIAEKELDKFNF